MDHEQNFCPGDNYWTHGGIDGCPSDHYAVDFASYIVFESQALAKMAEELGLKDRAAYWTQHAGNVAAEMNELLWDEDTGFYYDRYFNGTLMTIKTIAGFYPLLFEGQSVESTHIPLKLKYLPAASQSCVSRG